MMGSSHCAVAITAATADLSAKRAAVDLLRAAEALRRDHSTTLSLEMAALFDAATYLALTGTMAGWAADIAEPIAEPDHDPNAAAVVATHLHLVSSERGSAR
jgi:hypothetical protein